MKNFSKNLSLQNFWPDNMCCNFLANFARQKQNKVLTVKSMYFINGATVYKSKNTLHIATY